MTSSLLNASDKSIAVLPFVNMSSDPDNEYFSDGITEEIINALTRVEGLKVIARTSAFAFKGVQIDIREIGSQLGVSTVLEGSVRKYGNKVRVTAQLINSGDGTHIFSENFDRDLEDIFQIQDEISLHIADRIREKYGHLVIEEHLVNKPTNNVQAYEYFLRARYYQLKWDATNIKKAIEFYDLAIETDPEYARAYYGNLQCYGLLAAWGFMDLEEGMQKAVVNFQKAREIDTNLPEYYQSFVGKYFWGEWNFQATYEQIQEALRIAPHYSDALEAMTELLLATGYFSEAESYLRRALNTDPLSANHHYTLANLKYMQKKYEAAIPLTEKALLINQELILAAHLKAMCLIRIGEREQLEQLIENIPQKDLILLLDDIINNDITLEEDTVKSWSTADEDRNQLVPYELFILANSNFKEDALALLKKYIDMKRGQIINYRMEPFLEPLRKFEEFHLLHESNLQPIEKLNEPKQVAPVKINEDEIENLTQKMMTCLEQEKPYLNPHLSLTDLANKLEIHPNKLSYIVNERTGKNFNEFINSFRVGHFKKIAFEEEYKDMTILGLAYESGFNSKTVFHTFFKKVEGLTPSAWLKSTR
ncbi:MAG: hypothetical protein SCALA702_38210 [Melioribacteraceae bacterium]|nr:MAG: hypothetical protein SCALA702_38210 [Melioribacteraceae bacterium]